MGKIYITGLEVDTLIGVYDWERVRTTQLLLDVTLDVDLSAAMQSDDVADTVVDHPDDETEPTIKRARCE